MSTLLEEAIESWGFTRWGVTGEGRAAPDGEYSFRPAPGARSVSELPGHVLLASTYDDGAERLRRAGEIAMLQTIRRFDGVPGTRLTWMAHGIDHESYHRGRLAPYVRLLGHVPALTRKIHGDAAE